MSGDGKAQEPGRRDEILAAALRLFVRDGYAATGIRAIAAEVGIREASIYYHFRSKDEIFGAIIDHASMGHLRIREVTPDMDLRDALLFIGRGFLDAMAVSAARDMVHLMLFEAAHQPVLAERYLSDVHEGAVAQVTEVIEARIPPDVPVSPASLARIFSGALVAYVLHEERLAGVAGRELPGGVNPGRYDYLSDVVELIVRGIGEG